MLIDISEKLIHSINNTTINHTGNKKKKRDVTEVIFKILYKIC